MNHDRRLKGVRVLEALLAGIAFIAWAGPMVGATATDVAALAPAAETTDAAASVTLPQRMSAEGLTVEFDIRPSTGETLYEGEYADVRFSISDSASGSPVQRIYPIVWMDVADAGNLRGEKQSTSCRDRAGLYLKGNVGMRPLIDLNSYFVLALNRDPTISVFDPIVGITGKASLYAQIVLKRAGADWAQSEDTERLYVSMPVADMVAVVDTQKFVVIGNIRAGEQPTRVMMQPDGKYLWVGNDARQPDKSGVTVIDVETGRVAGFIATGKGHHEIVLSADNRRAFVSNREAGTVTVIDVATLDKIADLRTGPTPISLAYSARSHSLYVADGETGRIAVVRGEEPAIVAQIETAPGLGPARFSDDGRWAVAVNPATDRVYVIDAATNSLAHSLPIEGKPYQVAFSDAFAYVRALDTERVTMIDLQQLDKPGSPSVISFPAGSGAPGKSPNLGIADGIVSAPGEAAVLVASPTDNSIYYYMEGMNAPMGTISDVALQGSGHRMRAVAVVDRTLREKNPGVYSAKLRVPAPGEYQVTFLLDAPRVLHCFQFAAKSHPLRPQDFDPVAVDFASTERRVPLGTATKLRFKLTDPATGQPRSDLRVRVLYYAASGQQRTMRAARDVGDGFYEVEVSPRTPGGYYLWVSAPSLDVDYRDLPYFSFLAAREQPGSKAVAIGSGRAATGADAEVENGVIQ